MIISPFSLSFRSLSPKWWSSNTSCHLGFHGRGPQVRQDCARESVFLEESAKIRITYCADNHPQWQNSFSNERPCKEWEAAVILKSRIRKIKASLLGLRVHWQLRNERAKFGIWIYSSSYFFPIPRERGYTDFVFVCVLHVIWLIVILKKAKLLLWYGCTMNPWGSCVWALSSQLGCCYGRLRNFWWGATCLEEMVLWGWGWALTAWHPSF